MERRTIRWLSDLVGYNDKAGGNLTSGGMMANFIGLKLARDCVSNDRIQYDGVQKRWSVYASEERHVSVDKAVDCVGLGRTELRALPTDAKFQVRLNALEGHCRRSREACTQCARGNLWHDQYRRQFQTRAAKDRRPGRNVASR